jgi:hypothetical protein
MPHLKKTTRRKRKDGKSGTGSRMEIQEEAVRAASLPELGCLLRASRPERA